MALVTPNTLETEQATGIRIRTDDDLLAAGARILRKLRCGAALVTRGEQGMSLFEEGRRPLHIPTAAREVFDVTGAGDTVIATVALAFVEAPAMAEAGPARQLRRRRGGGQAGHGHGHARRDPGRGRGEAAAAS